MSRLLAGRLLRLLALVVAVTLVCYVLLDATPGDPAVWRLGNNADPAALAAMRQEMGLDRPVLVRYLRWLGDAARFDFGTSLFTRRSVGGLLTTALPATIELLVLGELLAVCIAVPLALRAARRPGGLVDRGVSVGAFAALSIPSFVLALYLGWIFGVRLGWLPTIVSHLPSPWRDPLGNLRQMFLPSVTLAVPLAAVYIRLLRTDLLATLSEDYVLLATARGLGERRIMWRHVLRPSSTNLVTAIGMNVAGLVGGAVVIERFFAINGVGQLLVSSIVGKEFSTATTIVMLMTVTVVLVNTIIDVLYALVDPRIRRAGV